MKNYMKHLFTLDEDLTERETKVFFIVALLLIGLTGWVEDVAFF